MKNICLFLLVISIALVIGFKQEPTQQIKEGYLTTEDDVKLYYRIVGNGSDAIVIPAGMWLEKEFARLANKERMLIFYDPRCRGRSDKVTELSKLGMNLEISDLEELRRFLGKEKISLIGWSYLGAMVVLYAKEFPGNVKRVIQVGPPPPRYDLYMETTKSPKASEGHTRLEKMLKEGLDKRKPKVFCQAYWETYLQGVFFDTSNISRFHSDYYKYKNEMPYNVFFQIGGVFQSIGQWDWREGLKNINVPVLTIQGDHDTTPLDAAREWTLYMPNARFLAVSKAGHLPFVERPDIFYPAVTCFLDGDWPEKAEIIK